MNNIKSKILLMALIVCVSLSIIFSAKWAYRSYPDRMFSQDTMFKIILYGEDGYPIREWVTCGQNILQHQYTNLIYFHTSSGESYGISGTVIIERLQ